MSSIIYNIVIKFYHLAIKWASPFNEKARLWVNGRRNWVEDLKKSIDKSNNIVWFHVSSLGEFEQGRPVIEKIKQEHPSYKILVTFFSPSGYEIRKNYKGADFIFYLPPDSKKNAKIFLDIVRPIKIFFVKYEFWYHYLNESNKKEISTYLISAIFRENQLFFKPYGKWYKKMLGSFTYIFVQDIKSQELLEIHGIKNVKIAGDTRFDRVKEISSSIRDLPVVKEFAEGCQVIIAGSTWEPDEKLIIPYILNSGEKIKCIIAPHEIHESHVKQILQACNEQAVRYSEINEQTTFRHKKVLVIDNIGMLSSLYPYGQVAFIGGGFGKGIHNILEPATFGLPVVFGPAYHKFKEAFDLVEQQGAFPISNRDELKKVLDSLLTTGMKGHASKICRQYIESNIGATSIIMDESFS